MHVQPHHTAEELAACIRAEACAKVARRLTAVRRLALLGQAPEQVGPQALHSPPAGPHLGRTLQRRRPPRPPRPQGPGAHGSAECRAGAAPEVAHPGGPTPADGCCAFRGEDAQRILKEELGVLRGRGRSGSRPRRWSSS